MKMKREGGFKSFGVFTKFTLSKSWQAVLLSKNHLQYSGFLHNNFVDSSFSKTSWPSQLSSLNTHFLTIRLKECQRKLHEGQHKYPDGMFLVQYCKNCGFRKEVPMK
ncbi:hypothetical protein J4420_04205 [Candidatus Woesearchaeota archaeon]|nr:hypothetical protein [Candidatus Woesearchaeota archaeon]